MPEYVDHPVKDMKTWTENCAWRLDPKIAAGPVTLALTDVLTLLFYLILASVSL
jgi:hypothetical protein